MTGRLDFAKILRYMTETTSVVTRFAPSPTGNLHSGAYRTAIFAYLFARKHNGTFVLRIEDTDKERSKPEFENNIIDSLHWLGLDHDVFVRQSENLERHKQILEGLIASGHAYISKEEAKDGSGIIKELVRFKNPNTPVTFHDEIKGDITMDTTDLGDFVIAKNINEPLFHLAVVVDDFDVGVTHVIRGEDHVSNTPRQILIQRAIGAPTPIYAHLPLVLGPDKQKLSKRRGALAMSEYRELGFLPEAILNMVTMVGWNPGTDQELFTKQELINAFDLGKVQKSPAVFNPEKLDWINREWLKKLSDEEFENYISALAKEMKEKNAEIFTKILPLIRERISKRGDLEQLMQEGEFGYFFTTPEYDPSGLVWKKADKESTAKHIAQLVAAISASDETQWNIDYVKSLIWDYAEREGRGDVLWPMRFALSGREKSPDPFTLAGILGKTETLARLKAAQQKLS